MAQQVSSTMILCGRVCLYTSISSIGSTDFEGLRSISVTISVSTNSEDTTNDEVTLEYDDRVILRFTPDNPGLIPGLEGMGQYIRDAATVQSMTVIVSTPPRSEHSNICTYIDFCSIGDQF